MTPAQIHETCENYINGVSPGLHAEIGLAWAACVAVVWIIFTSKR